MALTEDQKISLDTAIWLCESYKQVLEGQRQFYTRSADYCDRGVFKRLLNLRMQAHSLDSWGKFAHEPTDKVGFEKRAEGYRQVIAELDSIVKDLREVPDKGLDTVQSEKLDDKFKNLAKGLEGVNAPNHKEFVMLCGAALFIMGGLGLVAVGSFVAAIHSKATRGTYNFFTSEVNAAQQEVKGLGMIASEEKHEKPNNSPKS